MLIFGAWELNGSYYKASFIPWSDAASSAINISSSKPSSLLLGVAAGLFARRGFTTWLFAEEREPV